MIKTGLLSCNLYYPALGQNSQSVTFKTHPKSRNIRISVKSDLRVVVTFPKRYSLKKAQEFFDSKIIWVKNAVDKLQRRRLIREQNQPIKLDLSTEEFLSKNLYLVSRCKQLAKEYNFLIGKIFIRRQKTIWGSCSVRNDISLNGNLVFLENDLIDYVILHELVHTKVKNHSQKFWNKLAEILPNCRQLDRQLKHFRPTFKLV